jgi:hypothetical protein
MMRNCYDIVHPHVVEKETKPKMISSANWANSGIFECGENINVRFCGDGRDLKESGK